MAKYLKLFSTTSDYESYMSGSPFLPNVSLCTDQNAVHFTPASAPQPIAVEGDVQIFADAQCTAYADGTQSTVYVRLNRGFGYDDNTYWNDGTTGGYCSIGTPTPEYDDPYFVNVWCDLYSDNFSEPFTAGQVVKCTYDSFVPVENPQTVFYAEDAQ